LTDDLVKRLREEFILSKHEYGYVSQKRNPDGAEAADRIEQLEADVAKLESNATSDAKWLATYHKWCEMNGCAPSSSDLSAARAALGEKTD
jgi:hypothetical protein